MSTPTFRSRAAGVALAATVATILTGFTGPEPSPGPGSPTHSSAPVSDTDRGAAADGGAVIGWESAAHHAAQDAWSDVVVVTAAHGRPLEVQQRVDGAWRVRRTVQLDATRTDLVEVALPRQWTHAPETRWRLHVPARGTLPAITTGTKRVTVTWHAATDPADPTVLVNKSVGVEPADWRPAELVTPDMSTLGSRTRLQPQAADALVGLAAASLEATGERLVLVSGFRSADYQADLFARYVREHGERRADRFSARPGHSEHQTGLAADVTQAGVPFTEFGGTPSSDWVSENAWRHGFVVRYTAGAEKITGYDPEPWHLRFVGTDLAAYLHATGRTLDEAVGTAD